MAYDGGYQGQQRPYNGPVAPRPPPQRQYPPGPQGPPPPQQQYGGPQYDQYQDDYGYGYDEYGPDPSQQYYDDANYPRGGQQQDYYGPGPGGAGRGRPIPGRGGPMQRPPPGDGGRGPYPPRGGPPPGQGRGYPPPARGGRPGPPERNASSDPGRRANGPAPMSPAETGFGGSPFPTFPGQSRKTDMDEEQEIINQMGGMEISGGRRPGPPSNRGMQESGRGPMRPPGPPGDGYGARGPQRPYPPQGFPDQRRGPGPDPGYGPQGGYGDDEFGPPARSMTMPNQDQIGARNGFPPRGDSAPYNGPVGRGMPPRPSTAQGTRGPPPPGGYPANGGPPGPNRDAEYDRPPRPASFDEFYDSYYDSRPSNEYPPNNPPPARVPDFANGPSRGRGDSLDQHMQGPPLEQPQRGAARIPEVSRTKSQPDLRQPQAAVFEMAGDIPPMPGQYQPGYQGGQFNGPGPGLPSNPAMMRQGGGPTPPRGGTSPDSLPSHPTPVRPGLMPNSLVSLGNKPPPVRNYTGGTPAISNMPQGPSPPQSNSGYNKPPPAAEPAVPVTIDELERLRSTVKSDPNDQDSALLLARKLVEAADVLVPLLPDPKSRARSRERYVMDAQKILKKLSSANNPAAMFFLADCLGRGLFGNEPDNKEAFTLYQSAAKLGHAAAAYRTAVCCEIGNEEGGGTRKDPLKAIQWYKRAATLGDTPAMYKVGMILLKGLLGQPRNPREAVGWLKRAAERADTENPHALHELGLLYESAAPNDAIVRDEAYAFTLFRQAAELGYKFSQFRMGCAFEYGLMGCPIDPRQSIMWYSRAATQEEHQSELALSGWYLTGSDGVLGQSDTEAYLWARKAAVAGLAKAEYAMGYFTEVGIGVPANLEDAKRWYWRAAAQEFPKARERLEDLKRTGKSGPRQRERISRSKIGKQQEGECTVM